MSLASKFTFSICCAITFSIIGFVHYKQEYERKQLHLGVERDIERQERRKAQNLFNRPIDLSNKAPATQEPLQAS